MVHYIYGLWDEQQQLPPSFAKLVKHNEEVINEKSTIWYRRDIERLFLEAGFQDTWVYLNEYVSRKVVLADLARYLVLWKHAGLYLDLDVRVNHDLRDYYNNDVLLFTEHDNCNPLHMGPLEDPTQTHRIYNCMMYCSDTGRTFFKKCFELAVQRVKSVQTWSDKNILWASGPDVITTVYHENLNKPGIQALPHQTSVALLTHFQTGTWRNNRDSTLSKK